jgi:hypothetical protein
MTEHALSRGEIHVLNVTPQQLSHPHYESTVHPLNNATQTRDGAQWIHTTRAIIVNVVGCATIKY